MNSKKFRGIVIGLGMALLSQAPLRAQAPGVPGNVGFNAAVARLLSDVPVFSANVETVLTNRNDKSRLVVPMRMLKRQDRFRVEVDLVKMKGVGVELAGVATVENLGMGRMTSLVLPEKKGMMILFPELKFSALVPLSAGDLQTADYKVSKKESGRETINGQSCLRQQVTLQAPNGSRTEATTWESPSLGNFPVRMLFHPDGSAMTMNFSKVNLSEPAADLFEVPKDYRQFDNISALMEEAATKAYKSKKSK